MAAAAVEGSLCRMDINLPSRNTTAFFAQAAISFAVASVAVGIGITYLPVDRWTRGFLAIGCLFLVSSAFTLAKCVRDHQESSQAQMVRLLEGHEGGGHRTAA